MQFKFLCQHLQVFFCHQVQYHDLLPKCVRSNRPINVKLLLLNLLESAITIASFADSIITSFVYS